MNYYRFRALLQADGWMMPAYVGVDDAGIIRYLNTLPPAEGAAIEFVDGWALPGIPNAHSHAFQYAMAGIAETHRVDQLGDFWSWREAMYKLALLVDPDDVEAIGSMVYAEMLRHGYTHVVEFHYLHHDPEGRAYANPAEMGERLVAAARTAGIKITLIPIFFQKGGFQTGPHPQQRRFISKTVDDYFRLFVYTERTLAAYGDARIGLGVHSLRAVALPDIVETIRQGPANLPFHIHVAEQIREVEDCLAYCGKRPAEWLLDHADVNERFALVHGTHLSDEELARLAASGATVVLCPSTEGNLGDGVFRFREYVRKSGRWCIGSDSHIGLNPLEELRMLDYIQRVLSHQRNTVQAARHFFGQIVLSGRQAAGVPATAFFSLGQPLDVLAISADHPLASCTSVEHLLPTLLYTSDSAFHLGTMVNGKWMVKNNRHLRHEEIVRSFGNTLKRLRNR
jgi:formimidoylglutamate deiminase